MERETLGDVSHWVISTDGAAPLADEPRRRAPDEHCFLLGDNRDRSLDLREFGSVPRAALRGKVVLGRAEDHRGR